MLYWKGWSKRDLWRSEKAWNLKGSSKKARIQKNQDVGSKSHRAEFQGSIELWVPLGLEKEVNLVAG